MTRRPNAYSTKPAPSHETVYCGANTIIQRPGLFRIETLAAPVEHPECPTAILATAKLSCGHSVRIVRRGRL